MTKLTVSQAKDVLSKAVRRLRSQGERVLLERGGKPAAAIVSLADLKRLEEIEDLLDAQAARKALRKPRKNIPCEVVRKNPGSVGQLTICPGWYAARLVTLVHYSYWKIAEGEIKDYPAAARLPGMSRARTTRVIDLGQPLNMREAIPVDASQAPERHLRSRHRDLYNGILFTIPLYEQVT